MSREPAALPSFALPPVTEVVLSVQFEPLTGFQLHHYGLLWSLFRDKFPRVESKPPIEPVFETFSAVPPPPSFRVELSGELPLPRMWLLNESGTELIQIQKDRFIHNWRKTGGKDTYPRYEHLRAEFVTELTLFSRWCAENGIGEVRANQCEVTYINQIQAGEVWSMHGEATKVTTLLSAGLMVPPSLRPDAINFAARYLIDNWKGADGAPLGRLHVEFVPAFSVSDVSPLLVMTLTARGAPLSPDIDGAIDFLDVGRETIVTAFKALTRPEMHTVWRLEDGS